MCCLQHYQVLPDSADLTFSYKLVPGAANDSKALNVAAMAGLPPKVLRRAAEVAKQLWNKFQQAEQLVHAKQAAYDRVIDASHPPNGLPTGVSGSYVNVLTDNKVAGQVAKRPRVEAEAQHGSDHATAN